MMITMTTTITETAILYTVADAAGVEVWRREVPFMQTEAYRAGGYHVTEAAREQERIAMRLAGSTAREEI